MTPLEAALTLRVAGKKVATVRGSLWRIVGGFNFQWSWSSATVAGRSAGR